MKMLTAIIKPFKLDEVREAVMNAGIAGCLPALNYRTLEQLREAIKKLNELKATTTPEMIEAQAEYYRKLYKALVTSGFSKDEALKIVIAKASAK